METNIEKSKSDMRRGTLEFCTLLIIARGRAYTSDIIEALKKEGLIVVEGTLYPLLSRLAKDGTITHEWQESESGPPRKYYMLTNHGRTEVAALSATWLSLRNSIDSLIKTRHTPNK